MPDKLNRIKNSDFTQGTRQPKSWTWESDSKRVQWERSVDPSGLRIANHGRPATGLFSQRIVCKSEHWYRIEAVVSAAGTDDHSPGRAVLWVQPKTRDGVSHNRIRLAHVSGTTGLETLRAYFRTPPKTGSIEVSVGLHQAIGSMTVHCVHLVPNIEPDMTSHPLSLPPPPYAYPAPGRLRHACVVTDSDDGGALVAILRQRFGASAIVHRRPGSTLPRATRSQALIIAGDRPPAGMRSVSALIREGSKRSVIISLRAFVSLTHGHLRLRTIEMPDDPLNAKVTLANFITRGFSLHDVFPWASSKQDSRVFVQRHLVRGVGLSDFMSRHGFESVLSSQTDRDATSEQPLCLYKAIDGGGVIVCDVDPVATRPTSCDESNLAAFLLFNMLGADQTAWGQYIVPEENAAEFHGLIREFTIRFPQYRLHDPGDGDCAIELGAPIESFGLPVLPRSVIVIRTGLRGDDLSTLYGTLLFLKQLVRPDAYESPYVQAFLRRFRLIWLPLCAAWQGRYWTEGIDSNTSVALPPLGADRLGAIIDLTESTRREWTMTMAQNEPAFAGLATQITGLSKGFAANRYFYRAVDDGCPCGGRDAMSWRKERLSPTIRVDGSVFRDEMHRRALADGARLMRIEIPGSNHDFICNSIWRTDLAATALEHAIGLQFGVLASNRCGLRINVPGFGAVKPGEVIMQSRDDRTNLRAVRA